MLLFWLRDCGQDTGTSSGYQQSTFMELRVHLSHPNHTPYQKVCAVIITRNSRKSRHTMKKSRKTRQKHGIKIQCSFIATHCKVIEQLIKAQTQPWSVKQLF